VNGPHRSVRPPFVAGQSDPDDELRLLFHRLNNQLGIILACAELLEIKAVDDTSRTRAAEVVAKVLDAMGTSKHIRQQVESLAA
jgi:hypothetical protein